MNISCKPSRTAWKRQKGHTHTHTLSVRMLPTSIAVWQRWEWFFFESTHFSMHINDMWDRISVQTEDKKLKALRICMHNMSFKRQEEAAAFRNKWDICVYLNKRCKMAFNARALVRITNASSKHGIQFHITLYIPYQFISWQWEIDRSHFWN